LEGRGQQNTRHSYFRTLERRMADYAGETVEWQNISQEDDIKIERKAE
jgi:hypothetical protein